MMRVLICSNVFVDFSNKPLHTQSSCYQHPPALYVTHSNRLGALWLSVKLSTLEIVTGTRG